jgi:signal transduction histidine kinase
MLLVTRQAARVGGLHPARLSLLPLLHEPELFSDALRALDNPGTAFVAWDRPELQVIYHAAIAYARQAHRLAHRTRLCDPETAWVCGLLAPLGWLAFGALDPAAALRCLQDPRLAENPLQSQQRVWGLDNGAIARRLARRWQLPSWLGSIAGDLNLPLSVAVQRGADPTIFSLTRLAIARTPEPGLHLAALAAPYADEDRQSLKLPPEILPTDDDSEFQDGPNKMCWQDPRSTGLLHDLLVLGAENSRLRQQPIQARLEQEVDDLHKALDDRIRTEAQRLHEDRMQALGEFAAGAGHEINNPLAVISGQAQYLLGHAAEWFDAEVHAPATHALEAIIAQTRRIHGLLRDVMLFARPSPPCRGWFDLPTLLGEAAAAQAEFAASRNVRIELLMHPERLAVEADAAQVRTALQSLLRNAIEAAPAEGWARLALRDDGHDVITVAVEDSGPGPNPAQTGSLFDLFYSGRSAGRGRGLGLPLAWRLARQQGGDVRYCPPQPGQPTRFVLTLPRPHTAPPPTLFPLNRCA